LHSLNTHPTVLDYIKSNHFGKHLNLNFSIINPGYALYECKVKDIHLATPHAAHGGFVASILDSCMGVGALSIVCSSGKVVSTIELKVSFLKAIQLDSHVIVKSNCLKRGNNILHMEASMYNDKEELLAKSSGTFNSYPKQKAGY